MFITVIAIIELIIIIFLIVYVAYLQKLHYSEIKEIISRINTPNYVLSDSKPSKMTNIIRKKLEKQDRGGGR